jgi:NADPH-dependent glutamate synthase beta subunit-like oxidoreductase/NAD(P)H-flavin reductase
MKPRLPFPVSDLYTTLGLKKIHGNFLNFLTQTDPVLARAYNESPSHDDLVKLAPYVEDYLAELFDITKEVQAMQQKHHALAPVFAFKRQFVQRQAARMTDIDCAEGDELKAKFPELAADDLVFAKQVMTWLETPDESKNEIEWAKRYAAWQVHHNPNSGFLFDLPQSVDHDALVKKDMETRERNGFSLTDPGLSFEDALNQAHYCIGCHAQGKDSCSKGLIDRKSQEVLKNPLGNILNGCPLDQKISEMNVLKSNGNILGALAVITLDNPMVAATGYRICNDCMKACIFQKQDPVNIPAVETRILREVLSLPWGFEIYSLLTRWNPFNYKDPVPKEKTGYQVLVAGMGPAGFTLAHYLLRDGHMVVGVDGMKIEPLGINDEAVHNVYDLFEDLDTRTIGGFGGVAEYGITSRWDKNFLKIIRLILERHDRFSLFGGVRLGSNITLDQARELGFDHIAYCTGAGKPKMPMLKNILAPGVRYASDFLMALQLTGAGQKDSLANLEIRMPVVVIGAGLTAIDTATEAKAYYKRQLEKFERLSFSDAFASEKHMETVTIIYRKRLQDSPAYRLNHEELQKALEEGIQFRENATPVEIVLDVHGCAEGVKLESGEIIPAKTVLIATGTEPQNIQARNDEDVSCLGDTDPDFAGSVVKAMASAKKMAPQIDMCLKINRPKNTQDLSTVMDEGLIATVVDIKRLTDGVISISVKAPFAARNFQPGQFYRFQNYKTNAPIYKGIPLVMEGLALTGAYVEGDVVTLVVLESGASSMMCRYLKIGEQVILMGPTGAPTEIVSNKRVLLVGGGLGNAVLFSIGKAMREQGCDVTYIAGYRSARDVFLPSRLEEAGDRLIWCSEEGNIQLHRPQDISFVGNVVEAIAAHQEMIMDVEHVMLIGSDGMMAAAAKYLQALPFKTKPKMMASINSPMQCMMKEICAQCLQRHMDPKTGKEHFVFSCVNQDQSAETVDFDFLKKRLQQNRISENIAKKWLEKA